jgi:hypothetical protein
MEVFEVIFKKILCESSVFSDSEYSIRLNGTLSATIHLMAYHETSESIKSIVIGGAVCFTCPQKELSFLLGGFI